MNPLCFRLLAYLTFAVLVCAAPQSSRAEETYRILEIHPSGAKWSEARAINNNGDIVGVADDHAFLFRNGKMQDVGALATELSRAMAINGKGDFVGGIDRGESCVPFLFHARERTLFDNLRGDSNWPGDSFAWANSINDRGDIVGATLTYGFGVHAGLCRNGKLQILAPDPRANATATAINNRGDIVGWIRAQKGAEQRAFLYRDGKFRELGTLGGKKSVATALNEKGDVVGYASLASGEEHAFLYQNGKWHDLGTLGKYGGYANAINNSGDIVGYTFDDTKGSVAFLYRGGKMLDLNTLLPANSDWKLSEASGINDKGSIVGRGLHDGKERAFLMQPIVPPAK